MIVYQIERHGMYALFLDTGSARSRSSSNLCMAPVDCVIILHKNLLFYPIEVDVYIKSEIKLLNVHEP